MPWWGWLIAFGIVVASPTFVIVVVLMTRAMQKMNDDFGDRRDRVPGPAMRWPNRNR